MLELATADRAPTAVELLLGHLLDQEWDAQSRRRAPLEPTPAMRELLELVLAGTPQGIFAVSALTTWPAETPDELLAELRDRLPGELSPWTLRALRRAGSLREPQPLLQPGAPSLLLAAAPEPELEAPRYEALPAPEVACEMRPELAQAAAAEPQREPEPARVPKRRRRARLVVLIAIGTALGGGVCAAGVALRAPDVALGAMAGLAGAALVALRGSAEASEA